MSKRSTFLLALIVSILSGYYLHSIYPWLYPSALQAQEKKSAQDQGVKEQPKEVTVPTGTGLPRIIKPEQYGNVILDRYSSKKNFKPVVFPHWWHRAQYTCKVCHLDIGFQMQAGADDIKMVEIFQGKWCGKCHNGKIAFAPAGPKGANCQRCHSLGLDRKVTKNRDPRGYLSVLPPNSFGNRVDWVKAIDEGKITPKASIDGKAKMVVLPVNVVRPVPSGIMPDVVYPHKPHTQVLACQNCHPGIFKMKAQSNLITMKEIFQGQWCGRCHGKVAFPVEDCFRCHSKK